MIFERLKLKLFEDEIGCQCALSDTCETIDKPTHCNCDARGFNLTDVGILSSETLPIYGLRYGGSFTPYSLINFDIGPLVCSGKKGYYPSEAEDMEKEKLNSKLNKLTTEIEETNEDLQELSDQLNEHLRTTTTTTTTTTTSTTTTTTTTTTADPRLHFEKLETFKANATSKIGQITKYYHNYEFSMELKYGKSEGAKHLIEGSFSFFVKRILFYFMKIHETKKSNCKSIKKFSAPEYERK